jgi:hypothetical protein
MIDLCLGLPEDLPRSADDLRARASEPVRRLLTVRAWRARGSGAGDLLAALREGIAALPSGVCPPAPVPDPDTEADPDAHDAYCRIRRTEDQALHVLLVAALQSYEGLVQDLVAGGSTLAPTHWEALNRSYDAFFEHLRAGVLASTPGALARPLRVPYGEAVTGQPLERWIRGHHVFLVLIQALIVSLNAFETAHAAGETGAAGEALDLATVLMDGSRAALHYACDFGRAAYDGVVRPTMMPPHVPPGMSGLLARDHAHLVKVLHSQRARFAALDPALATKYECFVAAFGGAYEAHKLVCAHFGGAEHPSLLNGEAPETGIEALDTLKRSRLRSFMPPGAKPSH